MERGMSEEMATTTWTINDTVLSASDIPPSHPLISDPSISTFSAELQLPTLSSDIASLQLTSALTSANITLSNDSRLTLLGVPLPEDKTIIDFIENTVSAVVTPSSSSSSSSSSSVVVVANSKSSSDLIPLCAEIGTMLAAYFPLYPKSSFIVKSVCRRLSTPGLGSSEPEKILELISKAFEHQKRQTPSLSSQMQLHDENILAHVLAYLEPNERVNNLVSLAQTSRTLNHAIKHSNRIWRSIVKDLCKCSTCIETVNSYESNCPNICWRQIYFLHLPLRKKRSYDDVARLANPGLHLSDICASLRKLGTTLGERNALAFSSKGIVWDRRGKINKGNSIGYYPHSSCSSGIPYFSSDADPQATGMALKVLTKNDCSSHFQDVFIIANKLMLFFLSGRSLFEEDMLELRKLAIIQASTLYSDEGYSVYAYWKKGEIEIRSSFASIPMKSHIWFHKLPAVNILSISSQLEWWTIMMCMFGLFDEQRPIHGAFTSAISCETEAKFLAHFRTKYSSRVTGECKFVTIYDIPISIFTLSKFKVGDKVFRLLNHPCSEHDMCAEASFFTENEVSKLNGRCPFCRCQVDRDLFVPETIMGPEEQARSVFGCNNAGLRVVLPFESVNRSVYIGIYRDNCEPVSIDFLSTGILSGGSRTNGVCLNSFRPVQTSSEKESHQRWILSKVAGHYYNIQLCDPSAAPGLCSFLGCRTSSSYTSEVSLFEEDDCVGNQRWAITKVSSGVYNIKNLGPRTIKRYLTCRADSFIDLHSRDDNSGCQRWNFYSPPSMSDGAIGSSEEAIYIDLDPSSNAYPKLGPLAAHVLPLPAPSGSKVKLKSAATHSQRCAVTISERTLFGNVKATIKVDRGTNDSKECLALANFNKVSLIPPSVAPKNNISNRQWSLIKIAGVNDNCYNIRFISSKSWLFSYIGANDASGVSLYKKDDNLGNQRWSITEISSGIYNIQNLGPKITKRYLSCRADGFVDLYSHDDNSGRQQWDIECLCLLPLNLIMKYIK